MVGERDLAAATIRRRFARLRAFFRRLSDLVQMPDPFAVLQLRLPRRKRLPRTLSRPDVVSLLSTLTAEDGQLEIPSPVLPTSIRLMVSTGLRVGELYKLRINDVASDGLSLRVHGKGSCDRLVCVTDAALRHERQHYVAQRRETNDSCDALAFTRGAYGRDYRDFRNFGGKTRFDGVGQYAKAKIMFMLIPCFSSRRRLSGRAS